MSRLIMLSNRCEPEHGQSGSLLPAALGSIFRKRPGIWFGWNGEISPGKKYRKDRCSHHSGYRQHSWGLTPGEYDNFYQGYIHNVLWPVFHNRPDLIHYKKEYFTCWKNYNHDVKERVAAEIGEGDVVWVQDYHLLLSGKMLREDGHANRCGFFLHQPFPPGEILRSVPEHDAIMQAFFSYDQLGFQSSGDVNNFLAYALRFYRVERLADNLIQLNGHAIKLGIFPCGIDKETPPLTQNGAEAMNNYHRQIIISNDTISDISGVHYHLDAMEIFLHSHPEFLRDVSLLQLSDTSRGYPYSAHDLCARLERQCGEINGKFGDASWYPVNYIRNNLCHPDLIYALYRKAHVAMFTPLCEAMNLRAKAFILAQDPEDPGVLMLSAFTGTAEQLGEAVLVNPYDAAEVSRALYSALTMPLHERKRRHHQLLAKVERYDAQWWARAFLDELCAEPAPAAAPFRTSHHGIFTPQRIY
ncbi:trehalose-6-phosphate synthase [Cedecea davisae]|uniref:alpha,alpha-trehalose-phosphate synthase (UDP-forming) n=1 Tax=Cedecea davisae TaxID=158484 RepID=UPI00376F29C6